MRLRISIPRSRKGEKRWEKRSLMAALAQSLLRRAVAADHLPQHIEQAVNLLGRIVMGQAHPQHPAALQQSQMGDDLERVVMPVPHEDVLAGKGGRHLRRRQPVMDEGDRGHPAVEGGGFSDALDLDAGQALQSLYETTGQATLMNLESLPGGTEHAPAL